MKNNKFNLTKVFLFILSLTILIFGIFISHTKSIKILIISLITLTLVILDFNMNKVAKLSKDNPKVKTMRYINRLTIALIIILGAYSIFSSSVVISKELSDKFLVIGFAVFIMIFGNIAPKIPFNKYLGLRLPWTIRDEATWKIAHKITGYLAFPIGILMIACSFFLKAKYIFIVGIISWVLIPSIYSLWFYYKRFQM